MSVEVGEKVRIIEVDPGKIEIITMGVLGPMGPQGPPGGGAFTYIHDQMIATSVWTVSHNLGGYPNVTTVDSAGTTVEGDIVYNSANQLTITFSAPFSGKAYLS